MHKYLYTALVLLGSSLNLSAAAPCDWPSVNHDLSNTRSSPCTTITFADVPSVGFQWKHLGTAVQAAPVVSDGYVYYGDANTPASLSPPTPAAPGNLYSFTTAGVLKTQYAFPNDVTETVNGPPVVVGNVVYATTVSASGLRLYAFTTNLGILTPITSFGVNGVVDVDPGFTSASANILAGPVVVDNLVIVATSNATAEETTTLNPTYRGGFQAFYATTGTTPGALVWRTRVSPTSGPHSGFGTSGGSWSTAAVDTNLRLMFVGTTNATTPPASPLTDALLAIDYTTGVVKWSRQYTADDVYSFQYACGFDYDLGASPNLFTIKNRDVVGVGSKAGCYRVFERSTGNPIWCTLMIGRDSVPSIDGNPSAAYANGTVYTIANSDTSGISYNAFSVLAQYGLQFGDFAPIEQLLFYLGNTDFTFIRAIDAKSGIVKWTNETVSASLGSITEANGVLYTGNFLGDFRALNAATGQAITIANLGGTIGAPITVVGNQIFIGASIAGAGGLYVYGL